MGQHKSPIQVSGKAAAANIAEVQDSVFFSEKISPSNEVDYESRCLTG